MVELGNLIEHFRVLLQGLKAMSAAFRYVDHASIARGEFDGRPLPKSWRLRAEIQDYVVYASFGTTDQFGFLMRFGLKVHSPQYEMLDCFM
jgi:hypothetical protein